MWNRGIAAELHAHPRDGSDVSLHFASNGIWLHVVRSAVPLLLLRDNHHPPCIWHVDQLAGDRIPANEPTPWIGIEERVNIYATMLWLAVLAFSLLRAEGTVAPLEATGEEPKVTAKAMQMEAPVSPAAAEPGARFAGRSTRPRIARHQTLESSAFHSWRLHVRLFGVVRHGYLRGDAERVLTQQGCNAATKRHRSHDSRIASTGCLSLASTQRRTDHDAYFVVFLAGDHVVKLKRPVDYGFVDQTSLATRHQLCLDELTLNRRLTSGVYLSVEPVIATSEGFQVGGDGGQSSGPR